MNPAGCLAVFLIAALSGSPALRAQVRNERAVKAAFVFNLTKYVEWPPGDELVICAVGTGDMPGTLQKSLSGKPSGSRTIRVILSPANDQASHCQMVFIAQSNQKYIRASLERFRNKNVLTVSDTEPFIRAGGMIGLVRNGDRIQIEVNMEAVRESGLKLSSRLLNVAVLVHCRAARKD